MTILSTGRKRKLFFLKTWYIFDDLVSLRISSDVKLIAYVGVVELHLPFWRPIAEEPVPLSIQIMVFGRDLSCGIKRGIRSVKLSVDVGALSSKLSIGMPFLVSSMKNIFFVVLFVYQLSIGIPTLG
jgi:hypothetical protein